MLRKKSRDKNSNKSKKSKENIGMARIKKNTRRIVNSENTYKKQYVGRRTEVYGIIIAMLAILLFLSFFSFGRPGIVTEYINNLLSYVFGITKYFFAFLLFVWGISFFIKRVKYLPSRFGWGFFLLYLSISGLISNNFVYTDIFDAIVVRTRGGIIGAGIFYGLYRLVGRAGAVTILAVFCVCGILIITRVSIVDISKRIITKLASNKIRKQGDEVLYKDNTTGNGSIAGVKKMAVRTDEPSDDRRKSFPKPVSKEPEIISFEERQGERSVYDLEKLPSDSFLHTDNLQKPGRIKSSDLGRDTVKQLSMPLSEEKEFDKNYKLPPLSILKKSDVLSPKLYKQSVSENVNTLNQLFYYFNLPARITSVTRGPSVTLYEVALSQGVKVSKLLSLEDDFCVALGSPDLRFLTPIPGKSAIGIEVPNKVRSLVTLGDIFSPNDKVLMNDLLTVPLGKNFSGDVVHMSINNMPHILIAGATNSGKSVCLNSIIVSLLMKVKPSQARFIMIDPKMVELSLYNGIPHLLAPVIVDPRKSASVLSWVLDEMKNRFQLLLDYNCKTLVEYNFMVQSDMKEISELKTLPYILVIIDELADLMMIAAAEVEDSICRIAQMARAVGIHLIISTQKPIVKILTGLIKTNIPARIAFKVTDFTDSRVILEHGGAEKLIGKGDMMYLSPHYNRPERLQGAFVTTKEISLITNYIKNQMKAEYNPEIRDRVIKKEERVLDDDELLYDALKVVIDFGHASASLLQRKLRLGYSRAARIIDQLEEKGFI
ncbi:MAG: DNA translocase FtsK, partial [Actinobacteria bacterium]|nr:DNA translocase FtsK [Actinomycetota bacterium]